MQIYPNWFRCECEVIFVTLMSYTWKNIFAAYGSLLVVCSKKKTFRRCISWPIINEWKRSAYRRWTLIRIFHASIGNLPSFPNERISFQLKALTIKIQISMGQLLCVCSMLMSLKCVKCLIKGWNGILSLKSDLL